jgi:hypothetical protein
LSLISTLVQRVRITNAAKQLNVSFKKLFCHA